MKYCKLLRILNLFIKSFVNPVVEIALTFSSFDLFSTSSCFVLFEVTFLFELFNLSSKSVFFTKLVILFLLPKFACPNLAENFF